MAEEDVPLDVRVSAIVERLRAANDVEAADLLDRVHSSLEHTRYWYGTRHERLWHWAHAELTEQQRQRFFSIVANGTASANEPPTYAQQFNMMKWRMEKAEAEVVALRKASGSGAAS